MVRRAIQAPLVDPDSPAAYEYMLVARAEGPP
jgi:hypothetical protein